MLQIHYIRASVASSVLFFARSVLFLVVGLALVALVACSSEDNSGGGAVTSGSPPIIDGEWPFDASGESEKVQSTPGLGDLNLENVIKIEFKNGGAPEITNPLSEVTVTNTGENVVVTAPDVGKDEKTEYSFVISGTTSNGSVKFYGDVRKALYLNGVNITNSKGPAINIQGGKRAMIHLINGTQNFLVDGPKYDIQEGEQAKGTFFSEGKLDFEGSGSLDVKGKGSHAIVVDNDIEVRNGKVTVSESVKDGVHANKTILVSGGVLKISSVGDAIQSERKAGGVIIAGGKVKVATGGIKSHGIASDSAAVSIKKDAIVQISVLGNGSKGIRSRGYVEFQDNQKTLIKTSGTTDKSDPTDESNSAGIKVSAEETIELFLEGGELTIKATGDGSKGINAIDASISAGKIDIDADDDGLRVHGELKIPTTSTASGSIKSKKKKAINADTWDGNKGGIITQDGGF